MNKNFKKQIEHIFLLSLMFLFFTNSFGFANTSIHESNCITQTKLISISKEITIRDFFTELTNKTTFQFFYSSELKELNKKVRININNVEVKDALQKVLSNTNLEYNIKGNDIMIRKKVVTKKTVVKKATLMITGVVFDELGLELSGVNVNVLDSKVKGAVTDFDGKFSLEALPEDSLVFSYMGYETQTHKVGDKTVFSITMKPSSNALDEVIIAGVASGTSKKKMSVSVTKIKSDDLNLAPQSSISAALSGKVAGVNITSLNGSPGSGSSIVLRGATSLAGGQTPMILIDGVIMRGSLADINVDDVESMEIVKGAAASALYGSRAGNGVIVITSKRGKGNVKNKVNVTFRSRFELQRVAKYLNLSDSHPYELAPNWQTVDSYTKYNGVQYPNGYVTGYNPNIIGNRVIKYDGYMDLPYRVNNNLQKSVFNDGASYTNYIAASYRTNKANVFISFEDNKDKGIIIETGGYKRNSFRANIDYHITDKIKLTASNNYITTKNSFTGGGTGSFFEVLMMEPDVDLFKKNDDGQLYNFIPNHWNQIVANPLYDLWKKESDSKKDRFLGSYKIKYKINNLLSAEVSYALESQKYNRINLTPEGTFIRLQDDIFQQQEIDIISIRDSKILEQNLRATLSFSKSWNDLDFKGKLSYLNEDSHFDSQDTNSDDYLEEIKAENYFAIASLVYKDRYIFDALYRYDGSSLFGENERWQSYYRLSGAYRITKDLPINNVEELKIRMAYGTSGQRPGFSYQYETFSENDGILSKQNLGNKDLKPSESNEFEIGLDASFFKRFTFEATYSNTITKDQFVKSPLAAPFSGFKFQWANVGTLQTNTFETSLQAKIIKGENLNWNLGITFDKTRSKITKLDIPDFFTGPRSAFKMENGGKYGIMYGSKFVRTLRQMQEQLPSGASINEYEVNRDGIVVRSNDIGTPQEAAIVMVDENGDRKNVKIGDINPEFRMGLNSNITYKNFSFYTLWKWKNGGEIYNGTAQFLVRDNRHPMMDQRFTKPENKKSVQYFQSLYDAQSLNEFWVEDASYLRLNEAALYYTLKPKNKGVFNELKVGLIGKNLYTFTNYSGYDPEAGYSGFLFDNFGYPNFKNYAFSLEIKF